MSIDPEYLDNRMREIQRFEDRAAGKLPSTRKAPGAAKMLATPEIATPKDLANNVAKRSRARNLSRDRVEAVPVVSLLDVIMRAGSDPAFDVEKFERLVAIQQSEQDRQEKREDRQAELEAEAAFNAAMADVQSRMKRIATDAANPSTRSRYASYGALDDAIRPLYTAAGFRISYNEDVGAAPPEMVRVLAYVTHTAPGAKRSHKEIYHTDVPVDSKGARGGDVMTKTHANKSGKTYGKRELLGMIFNIAIGKDDDGNAAGRAKIEAETKPGTITATQAADIRKLLSERNVSERAFTTYIRLPSIEHIGAEHFERARAKIISMGVRT